MTLNERIQKVKDEAQNVYRGGKETVLNYLVKHLSALSEAHEIKVCRELLTMDKKGNPGYFEPNELFEFWAQYRLCSPEILDDETRADAESGALQPEYDKYLQAEVILNQRIDKLEKLDNPALFDQRSKILVRAVAENGQAQIKLPGNKETKTECQEAHSKTKIRLNELIRKVNEERFAGEGTDD